jgi:hypothetical protein
MQTPLHRVMLAVLAVGLLVPAVSAAQDVVYTGCIKSGDGSLYNIRQATTPMAPCKGKDKQISWNMAGQPGPPGPPLDITVNVDCNAGQSINDALAQAANKLTVLINGSCEEGVVITRDDVTLQGVGTNPTIMAPEGAWSSAIRIEGARGVSLWDLQVVGGGCTLNAERFASFVAGRVRITGASHGGLCLDYSAALLRESEISQNEFGAFVGKGSSLIVEDSKVIDNRAIGLQAGGDVSLRRTEVARNSGGVYVAGGRVEASGGADCAFRDNRDYGVSLDGGHLTLDECLVEGSYTGLEVASGSAAQLNSATVQGNGWAAVGVGGGSHLFLSGQTVINGGSGVGVWLTDTCSLRAPADISTVTGTPWGIYCAGPPSVAQLTWPLPGVVTNCLPAQ